MEQQEGNRVIRSDIQEDIVYDERTEDMKTALLCLDLAAKLRDTAKLRDSHGLGLTANEINVVISNLLDEAGSLLKKVVG